MKYQLNSPQRYARTIYFIAKTSVKLMIPFKNRQKACWLVRDVMDMGPVYIKIGQIVSSRTDIFPDYLTIPLSELQNNVYSSNFDDIKTLFYNNFSEHIYDVFDEFDETPFASASIGQVHLAKLKGRTVAVKIIKPNILEDFKTELQIILSMLRIVKHITRNDRMDDMLTTFTELEDNISRETNLIDEMRNMIIFRKMFENNSQIVVPRVYRPLCGEGVLTMEYVESTKITGSSINSSDLAKELMYSFISTLVNYNYIHCDPHPGNIGITKKNKIVLYDFGMVKKFDISIKDYFKKILFAILNRNTDELITFMLKSGILIASESNAKGYTELTTYEYVILKKLIDYIYKYLGNIDPKQFVANISEDKIIDANNIPFTFSNEMVYLFKTFSTLEGVCKELNEDFNYLDLIEDVGYEFFDFDLIFDKITSDMTSLNLTRADIDSERKYESKLQLDRLNKRFENQNNRLYKISFSIIVLQLISLLL
jgi:ubiquinone biosynthesis protein